MTVRVAILDDHISIIDGYNYRLSKTPEIEVVATGVFGEELEPLLAALNGLHGLRCTLAEKGERQVLRFEGTAPAEASALAKIVFDPRPTEPPTPCPKCGPFGGP